MDECAHRDYFSRRIFSLARESTLIRFAACAASAKQLGHMKDPQSEERQSPHISQLEKDLRQQGRDFLWCGAKYYGKAIQAMSSELMNLRDDGVGPFLADNNWTVFSPGSESSFVSGNTSEARLLAICIMCQYERLSASHRAKARHLDGLYRLFGLERFDSRTDVNPAMVDSLVVKAPLRSLFWHFVQNDLEEART